jgi:hypothetical protein
LVGVALCLLAFGAQAQESLPGVALDLIAPLDNGSPIGYYIGDPDPGSQARSSDAELCRWALNDWVTHADGRLVVFPGDAPDALIRVFFVSPGQGQYGEMRPFELDGRRGAAVFIRPDINALDPDMARTARSDPLLRETIVYLTCLHELGHALGLEHTADFADVMYYFGFGGDIPAFFGRYRSRLSSRDDIATTSGLSAGDLAQLAAAYAAD